MLPVHLKVKPFQCSYLWPEDLEGYEDLMANVDT